ncbi:putative LRR receptor-like serine/threonine-protein kinase [Raphanus sativus]|uniref:non-specific serine/threonine protein kinase n=1 Tax=Raphanus sativus TaxID=3726 RepID=A0A6J0JX98_RAPSA|nr:probable LRR receptor-like serine/threonine-protein kinase At3g47570 isoform X2 [Raphanus sativus]KAJ4891491.1 putative LRR receptor-like serine/threonine-protein kinase [Raphanus sativus]
MKLFLLLAFNILILFRILDARFSHHEASKVDGNADRKALLVFKSQVSANNRLALVSWNDSTPLCQWKGVTCGRKHKRVTGLDLGGLQLGGIISPAIGNLSFLRSLNLEENSFGGTIPKEVGKLSRLQQLNMSYNNLKGVIPTSLSNCSRLVTLVLTSNNLVSGLPSELGSLSSLESLLLSINNLSGRFPTSLGNLTSLEEVSIAYNNMEGEVPKTIGRLTQLIYLQISMNNLSGDFPPAIYNLSSLRYLFIGANNFSGSLRSDFGYKLATLIELKMGMNYFSGDLPKTISNISTLKELEVSQNHFTGSIPVGFGTLQNIQYLGLHGNSFGGNSLGGDLEFLKSLVNCTKLQMLDVGDNRLGGELPIHVANLSKDITKIYMGGNLISGSIPHEIGNLINLQAFSMESNLLTQGIPASLGKISGLVLLALNSNRMSGEIPSDLGNITGLERLHLFQNNFQGSIPPSLGNCRFLLYLWIGYNRLNGTIPREIMQLESLVQLFVNRNMLTGPFPKDVGRLKKVSQLSVADNRLSGNIPETIGECLYMENLYLGGNAFDGAIPDIRNLRGLTLFNLSNNSFSGNIPEYLANFSSLEVLDLSGNNFQGAVPTKGVFKHPEKFSVSGNRDLCGGIPELKLKPCPQNILVSRTRRHSSNKKKKIFIGVGVGVGVAASLLLLALSLFMKRKKKSTNHLMSSSSNPPLIDSFYERVSYEELRAATNEFSSSNLIGSGNFGSVFRGLLGPEEESKAVAVKVLNLQTRGAAKSFTSECEALKGIRHRNLVKLVTSCSSIDFKGNEFKALVYEFMPNGNLDTWLHHHHHHQVEVEEDSFNNHSISRPLKLSERLNIAVDVASVVDYIHSHCYDPVAHCDLKPSNVLLDNDLTAHVSDFGLARIIDQESFINQVSSTVRGTIGYAAPEYGMGGKPSREGDLYSFGVLLLEMFTRKRPTDELFVEGFTLRSYTESALAAEHVLEIADVSILSGVTHNKNMSTIAECLKMVFNVGIRCCEQSPTDRMTMAQALPELVSLRKRFLRTM